MRLILLAILSLIAVPAAADQTDPRLDRLFEELRTGEGGEAADIAAMIQSIWNDSQSDTVDLLYERALAARAADQRALAVALLDHAVGLAPNFMQAHALRGSLRLASGDQAGALGDFMRAIELEPRQYDVRIAVAELMAAGGDKRGAYEMLQEALEWNPHEEYALERARELQAEINGSEI